MNTPENTTEREGLSVREAAGIVGVSVRTMQTLIAGGTVPSFTVGRRRIVRRSALIAWMQREERRAAR